MLLQGTPQYQLGDYQAVIACMKKLPVVDPEKYINDIYRTCDDPVLLACIPMLSDRFRQLSKMKNPVVVSAHLLLTVIHLETEYKSAKNMGGIFNGEMLPDVLSGIINHTTCETGIDAISDAIKCCMIFSCDEHRVGNK